MPTEKPNARAPQPPSLEGHVIPEERLAQIGPLMVALSATAIAVSDLLPLAADAGDFAATLEAEPE